MLESLLHELNKSQLRVEVKHVIGSLHGIFLVWKMCILFEEALTWRCVITVKAWALISSMFIDQLISDTGLRCGANISVVKVAALHITQLISR